MINFRTICWLTERRQFIRRKKTRRKRKQFNELIFHLQLRAGLGGLGWALFFCAFRNTAVHRYIIFVERPQTWPVFSRIYRSSVKMARVLYRTRQYKPHSKKSRCKERERLRAGRRFSVIAAAAAATSLCVCCFSPSSIISSCFFVWKGHLFTVGGFSDRDRPALLCGLACAFHLVSFLLLSLTCVTRKSRGSLYSGGGAGAALRGLVGSNRLKHLWIEILLHPVVQVPRCKYSLLIDGDVELFLFLLRYNGRSRGVSRMKFASILAGRPVFLWHPSSKNTQFH